MLEHPLAQSHPGWLGGRYVTVAVVSLQLAGCTPTPAKPETPTSQPEVAAPAAADAPPSPPRADSEAAPVVAAADEAASTRVRRWSFDADRQGALPAGWSAPTGAWTIAAFDRAPSGAHALVQTAPNAASAFNIALVDDAIYADVDIAVQLHAIKGRIDRGGGVVWRARDERNYYVARYNPLEDNYRVYHVKNGERRQLGSADVKLDADAWHTLRVRMVGDHIEGFLDGEKQLDAHDGTFAEAGKIGLWTKADANTVFDDLRVEGLDEAVKRGDNG